jgi:hypothetical protein
MEIKQVENTIVRSGDFQETAFKIAANAQAFEILSKNLYSDPMTAIIRELSTNAADSHTDAGNPEPFDVHLPNSIDPEFVIRDYGTGLSQEDVEGIYSTYFESNRNGSNECTGGFGLGSKTPFALVDMFSFTSYFKGMKYEYSVFKGEAGAPTIALLNKTVTVEKNGVEIKLHINERDIWDFNQKAQKVYAFFKLRPNVTGARLDFTDYEPALSGDGWSLYRGYSSPTRSEISIVMGNVCYNATGGGVRSGLGHSAKLMLEMNVGDCTPTPSREELHYDEKTIGNLQAALTTAEAEACVAVLDTVKDAKTRMERIIKMDAFRGLVNFDQDEKSIDTHEDGAYTLYPVGLAYRKKTLEINRHAHRFQPKADRTYVFIQKNDDCEISYKEKRNLRHYLNGNNAECFLVKIDDAAKFAETFGEVTVKLSDLPDAPKKVRSNGTASGTRTYVKKLNCRYRSRVSDMWDSVDKKDVDVTNAIAIERIGYKCIWMGREYNANEIQEIAVSLGYTSVYGLPQKRYEKLRAELGLDDLATEARKKMEDFVKTADQYTRARVQYGVPREFSDEFLNAVDGLSDASSNLVKLTKAEETNYRWNGLLSLFNLTLPKAENFTNTFKEQYPLVANIDLDYAKVEDVIEYIQLKS